MKIIYQFVLIFILGSLFLSCGQSKVSPEEEQAWKDAIESNTLNAIDSFLMLYPETNRKEEIAYKREGILFRTATAENTVYYYNKYLKEFPQGKRKKEIEEKLTLLKAENISVENLTEKIFVGVIRYLDGSRPDIEILSMKFSSLEDNGSEISCMVSCHVSSSLKKEMKAIIQKDKFSIKFVEEESDEFLLELPEGKIYLKDNKLYLESTDPNQKQYWNLQ
jgi:hypothetical protein